jgi:hypothetical protein
MEVLRKPGVRGDEEGICNIKKGWSPSNHIDITERLTKSVYQPFERVSTIF